MMNKINKFVCVDKEHLDEARLILAFNTTIAAVKAAKKVVKSHKYLKMKTIEDFKKTCSVGDALFVSHNDTLFYPMVVTSISDDRNEVRLEGCYEVYETRDYNYSGFDRNFMHEVKKIYPNGDPCKFSN